jgi:fumarate reductase subunit D
VLLNEKPFIYGKVPGLYWLALHQLDMVWVAVFAPIVVIIILLLIPGFLRGKQRGQLFLVFILIVLLVMVLTLFGPTIDQLDHIQTLRHSNHIYYLADSIPFSSRFIIADACLPSDPADYDPDCFPGYFTHKYFVYRCGGLGMMCRGIGYEAFEEHKYASEGRLFIDSQGNMVLSVDGRMVWTYPTSDQ